MSDFNSSLPVRTQNNGDLKINITDGTIESQLMTVNSDGSINTKITAALPAGSNNIGSVNQGTSPWITSDLADGSASGGTAGTKSLLAGQIYNSAAPTLTTGQQASLQADVNGNLKVTLAASTATQNENLTQVGGSAIALGQTTMSASLPVTIASNQTTINTKDSSDGPVTPGTAAANSLLGGLVYNSAAPTPTTGQQLALQGDSSGNLKVNLSTPLPAGTNSIGNIAQVTTVSAVTAITNALPSGTNTIGKVEITDGTNTQAVKAASTAAAATDPAAVVALSPNSPLPAGTNALGSVLANIQVGSAAVSNTNPVPVTVTSSVAGTAIQSYGTTAALAAGSSTTITYTVAASHTFNLERVWVSGSGKIKAVIQNGTTTIFVGFNSTANPNIDITVTAPPTIAAAGTVNVIITNLDVLPQDVYVTIEGNQN